MQTISLQEKRPPFVRFEYQSRPDPVASLKEGRPVHKDVAVAIVMQFGSRDEFVKDAEEWIDQKHREAANGTFDPDWVKGFRHKFDEWKKGNDIGVVGTHLKVWPGISPAEIVNCASLNIHTVEDLAQVSDAHLGSLGLNGRILRDKAKAYLSAASETGKLVEHLATLQADVQTKDGMIKELQEKVAALEAAAPRRGRPPKED